MWKLRGNFCLSPFPFSAFISSTNNSFRRVLWEVHFLLSQAIRWPTLSSRGGWATTQPSGHLISALLRFLQGWVHAPINPIELIFVCLLGRLEVICSLCWSYIYINERPELPVTTQRDPAWALNPHREKQSQSKGKGERETEVKLGGGRGLKGGKGRGRLGWGGV